ncbi:MAG: hypothetical protein ACYCPN_05295 [Thermoplasmata archaeon]
MSETLGDLPPTDFARIQDRTLRVYGATVGLVLVGIAVLATYAISIGMGFTGPGLGSPGGQQSFGLAVSLLMMFGAVLFHVIDRLYRTWPLGRHIIPTAPRPLTVESQILLVKVIVVVAAAAGIGWILAGLLM